MRLCWWVHWRSWSTIIWTPHPYQTVVLLNHVVRRSSGCSQCTSWMCLPYHSWSTLWRKKMFLKIDITKWTPLNFIKSSHTVISLYLEIMWFGRGAKPVLVFLCVLCTLFPFSECRFFPKHYSDTSASSRHTGQFCIPPSSISRDCLIWGHPIMSCGCLVLTPQE